MNIVIDTNIVFSALLNANGLIGELLLNSQDEFKFYAPELMKEEILKYADKLIATSKLTNLQFEESAFRILSAIELLSEDLISQTSWSEAFKLTNDVDENDTPFVALTIELKTILWTGDKKLINGLVAKGFKSILSTQELFSLRSEL